MQSNRYRSAVLAFILSALCSCTAYTGIEPLGRGNTAAWASLGGPIIKAFGLHIPLPYLALGASHGLRDNLDISGSLHVTSTLHTVLILDPAVTWYPVRQRGVRPTVGLQMQTLLAMGMRSGLPARDRMRIYPVLTGSSAWKAGPGTVYAGSHFMVPLTRPDYDDDGAYVLWSPFAGYKWHITHRARLSFELKYHAPNLRSNLLAVEYNKQESLGINYGALAPMVSFEWSFGGSEK